MLYSLTIKPLLASFTKIKPFIIHLKQKYFIVGGFFEVYFMFYA